MLGALIVLASAGALAADVTIVARVDGVPITASSLVERMNRLGPPPDPENASREEIADRRRAALDRLIVEEIAYRRAVAAGLEATPAEVDAAVGTASDEETRKRIAREIAVAKLYDRDVLARVAVAEASFREAYEREKTRFVKPEYALIVDVVVSIEDDRESARKRAEAIRAELVTRPDPWSLVLDGTFQVRNFEPRPSRDEPFLVAARHMEPGKISGIVERPASFHVFRLEEYRPSAQGTFEEARPHLEPALRREAVAARTAEWEKGMREGAVVEILEPR